MVWSGEGEDVVPHAVVITIPLDQKAFFPTGNVARQSVVATSTLETFETPQNLRDSRPAHPQKTGRFCPRFDGTIVQQSLIAANRLGTLRIAY